MSFNWAHDDHFCNAGAYLDGDQSFEYRSGESKSFKSGTSITFDDDSMVFTGTLASDQSLKYNATDSVSLKANTQVDFYVLGTGNPTGFVTRGTLSQDQALKYRANDPPTAATDSVTLKANTLAYFGGDNPGFLWKGTTASSPSTQPIAGLGVNVVWNINANTFITIEDGTLPF
ncbi:MAG TPA: hypothetical protein VG796_15360 [Verrucomicrobiales bacterium]|nr:hypothetical protein [Verrucomicrobiales bacterium]